MVLDPRAMDQSVTYEAMEPMIESIVYEPLPEGLVDPSWLELPELEPQWFELPEIEPGWLNLPELDHDWLQAIEQEAPSALFDTLEIEPDFDMEH